MTTSAPAEPNAPSKHHADALPTFRHRHRHHHALAAAIVGTVTTIGAPWART